MSDVAGCRAMEMLCRQRAKVDPKHSWKWLGEADRWRELDIIRLLGDSRREMISSRCTQVRWLLGQTLSTAILVPNNKGSSRTRYRSPFVAVGV